MIIPVLFAQCMSQRQLGEISYFDRLADIEKFEYEYSLNEGIKYKLLGDLPRAVYFFERCLEIYPYSDVSFYELANIYHSVNEIDQSLKNARRALEINPDNLWYYNQLSQILREANEYDQAISVYKNALSRFPDEKDLRFTLAAMLVINNQFAEALELYSELEETLGIDERISLSREHIYMEKGEFEKAYNEMSRLIEHYPAEPRYYGVLAELYSSIGMFDEALECYNKIFEIDPENGMAQISVAEFFLIRGMQTEALYYLKSAFSNPQLGYNEKIQFFSTLIIDNSFSSQFDEQIIELGEMLRQQYPEQDMASVVMIEFFLNTGDYQEAGRLLYDLYSVNSDNIAYAEKLIGITSYSGDYQKVIELGREMIAEFPESATVLYFSGIANHMLGHSDDAVEMLERALGIDGSDKIFTSHVYSYLGDVYNAKQDYASSDKYFNLALAIDSNIITLNNYAYYLSLRDENLETALEYSFTTIREEPDNASFLDTYAWILYKLEQYEEAEKYIELAYINGGDKSFEITKHYAAILIMLKKYEDAERYLNLAADLGEEKDIKKLDLYIEKLKEKKAEHINNP
jgi:tetratricopeptide (TPR) repeat protein